MEQKNGYFWVLMSGAEHKNFVDAVKKKGLIRVGTEPGDDGYNEPFQDIWQNPEQTHIISFNTISFVEDTFYFENGNFFQVDKSGSNVNYLWINGEEHWKFVKNIGYFAHYSPTDLCEMAQEAAEEVRHKSSSEVINYANYAISAIAIGYKEHHVAPMRFFKEYLTLPDKMIRDTTITAIGFRKWLECIPLLEETAKNDPDESNRRYAQEMIEKIQVFSYKSQEDDESPSKDTDSKTIAQLQQELKSNKQKLTQLRTQLKKVEERIDFARRTNIFGRPQSGENERERDKLAQEIKDVKDTIAAQESSIKAQQE